MAYFAKLDQNNVVIEINVISNDTIDNLPFPQSEPLGVLFLTEWSGGYPLWKQTSYTASFRKNFAGIGYIYDQNIDAFIGPKPFPSWLLNTNTAQWQPPIPYPNDGKTYSWDENTQSWIQVPGRE